VKGRKERKKVRRLVCSSILNLSHPFPKQTAVSYFYVVPSALEMAVMYVKERYNNTPMFITENGALLTYRFREFGIIMIIPEIILITPSPVSMIFFVQCPSLNPISTHFLAYDVIQDMLNRMLPLPIHLTTRKGSSTLRATCRL